MYSFSLPKIDQKLLNSAEAEQWDEVKQLLKQGANINCEVGEVLAKAILHKELEMVKYLVESSELNEHVDLKNNATRMVHVCSMNFPDNLEIVEFLFSKGLDFNKHEEDNFITSAIGRKSLDAVKILFKKGFKSHNLKDIALMLAVEKKCYPIIEFIIENGGSVHFQNNYFLRQAIADDDNELTDYLLAKGACLDDAYEYAPSKTYSDARNKIEKLILHRNLKQDLPVKENKQNKPKL